jgi:hypothetical protein
MLKRGILPACSEFKQNTKILFLGRMYNFCTLSLVVNKVLTGLKRVKWK